MHSVRLAGTPLECSRFIFGTASLLSAGTTRQRLSLLDAALEHGFTHFDTAPYYGFGLAERDLGRVLARRPAATVTSKVGLYSPGGEHQPTVSILLRKAAGRLVRRLARPTLSFDLARARHSLDGSLKRLRRERLDLFLLHEAERGLLEADEWRTWLEDEVRGGRVRAFGVAATVARILPLLGACPALVPVLQAENSLAGREADALVALGRAPQISYGYVSAALRAGHPRPVPQILADALDLLPGSAVIVSTKRIERLAQYAAVAGGRS